MEFNFLTSLKKAIFLSIKMVLIIIVVMILYEFFEKSKLYDKTKNFFNKWLKIFGFSANSSITMVVGVILGIAYGAGILIKSATEGKMTNKEIILSCLFLSLCHAAFEDTLIFVAVGANGFIIIGIRIFLAFCIIWMLNNIINMNLKEVKNGNNQRG